MNAIEIIQHNTEQYMSFTAFGRIADALADLDGISADTRRIARIVKATIAEYEATRTTNAAQITFVRAAFAGHSADVLATINHQLRSALEYEAETAAYDNLIAVGLPADLVRKIMPSYDYLGHDAYAPIFMSIFRVEAARYAADVEDGYAEVGLAIAEDDDNA